ncbi:UNVERIFIED_CONTAM: hypothetical protein HDU68_007992 [Siphonaria sp. JEL0065]|nr:hypothetical protein HDU68_007992 [Siphonaria sp. JEL0065]
MPVNVVLIGPGLVGSAFLSQLFAHQKRNVGPFVRVVAIASSSKAVVASAGIDLGNWKASLATNTDALAAAEAAATSASQNDPTVVVDCTSSDAVAARYPSWLNSGLHIVTPNKKGFSGSIDLFNNIKNAQKTSGEKGKRPLVFHESTVGAGLPILSTLEDLVATGDEIVKIEGIFSGTLSYIFNNYSTAGGKGTPPKFSDIVNVAKELGYTEPDPRDDLNGMDVGRKVVILGRVAGLPLSLDTLPIENIVPEPLRAIASADDFLQKLPEFDAHFAELNAKANANGRVLRCVGVVDPINGSSVRLAEYDASHPFAALKGSDNIIAFTTRRFPNPLIIQGAGAGDAVTAFGMFSDLLKIAARVEYSSQ